MREDHLKLPLYPYRPQIALKLDHPGISDFNSSSISQKTAKDTSTVMDELVGVPGQFMT